MQRVLSQRFRNDAPIEREKVIMTAVAAEWITHPWVTQARNGIRFGVACGRWLEARALIEYVQALEDLGFDSFCAIDHPVTFGADCWTMLAAPAATTRAWSWNG